MAGSSVAAVIPGSLKHRRPLATALCALMVVSGTALTALTAPSAQADDGWDSAEPPASTKADTQDCAQVLFVGARGSGESAPYGNTIGPLETELASRTQQARPDLQLAQVYLDYPAVTLDDMSATDVENMVLPNSSGDTAAYTDSVDAGVAELERLATAEKQRCPSEKLLVAGFSQGAEVVTRALASGQLDDNLMMAILLGNPLHFDGQNISELDGTAANRSYGLSAALAYLHAQASTVSDENADDQMKQVLVALFSLFEGTVDNRQLDDAMDAAGANISGTDAPLTSSVCMSDDPVCDAAGALTRILTGTTSLAEEQANGSQTHSIYTPDALGNTLSAVDAKLAALPQVQVQEPSPARTGLTLAAGAMIGGGVVALAAMLLFLRRARQRARRRAKALADEELTSEKMDGSSQTG